MTDQNGRPLIEWTRKIDAGHILQAVTSIALASVFCGGIYFTVIRHLSDIDGVLLVHNQRLNQDEERLTRAEEMQRQFISDISGKLEKNAGEARERLDRLLQQFSDLRVLVAQGKVDGARR